MQNLWSQKADGAHPVPGRRVRDFENFHMTNTWSPWLESGEVMVFSIDTIDQETWSDTKWRSILEDPALRTVASVYHG